MTTPQCETPGCRNKATCLGAYEGAETATYACNAHCGHGCEDGHCEPIERLAAQRLAALEAENKRLMEALVLLTPQHDTRWRAYQHEEGCPNIRDEHAECRCDGEEALKRIDAAREALKEET